MYSKQQASQLRQEFWTAFGQYMSPIPSAEGEKVNWINYRTGEKYIAFRMHADNKKAAIAVELTHRDEAIRQLYFELFLQFKALFEISTGEPWSWQPHAYDEHGKAVSLIHTEQVGCSIFRKEDWPGLISFFKPRIMALDTFWSSVKYAFESLR